MTVTPLDTAEITAVMDRIHGRDISAYDESFLVKSIGRRLAATGSPSSADYCRSLSENSIEAKALFDSLNISYSEFFRIPSPLPCWNRYFYPPSPKKRKAGQAGSGSGRRAAPPARRPIPSPC